MVVQGDLWAALAWVFLTLPPLSRKAVMPVARKVWQLAATPSSAWRTGPGRPSIV